jgi:hypothetical protein
MFASISSRSRTEDLPGEQDGVGFDIADQEYERAIEFHNRN